MKLPHVIGSIILMSAYLIWHYCTRSTVQPSDGQFQNFRVFEKMQERLVVWLVDILTESLTQFNHGF